MREPHRWGCGFKPAASGLSIPMRFGGVLLALIMFGTSFATAGTVKVNLPNLNPAANPAFLGAIILLSIAFVAVSYAVSTAIQNPSAIAWSKDQLREVVAGVILIVLVAAAYLSANALASSFVASVPTGTTETVYHGCCSDPPVSVRCEGRDNPVPCEPVIDTVVTGCCSEEPLDPCDGVGNPIPCTTETREVEIEVDNPMLVLGQEALEDLINDLQKIYYKVGEAYFSVGAHQGMSLGTPRMNLFYVQYSEQNVPFAGISHVMGSLSQAGYQLTFQILTFKVVLALLSYINIVVPRFVLPIGMAFRIFPFTKKLGNTLIAFSLGAMFMLPASLVIVRDVKDMVFSSSPDSPAATPKFYEATSRSFVMTFGGGGWGFYQGIMEFCNDKASRTFFGIGELIWGILFATLICIITLGACDWISLFQTFISVIWPLLMLVFQNIASALVLPFISPEPEAIYSSLVQPIVTILLPAVSEITAFSIISAIIIALFTIGGTKAISTAIGGEHVLYGISRLV